MNFKRLIPASALASALALTVVSTASQAAPPKPSKKQVERGEYLVKMIGCADCHTPMTMTPTGPGPDMDHWLNGHPEAMPMPPAPLMPPGPWLMVGAATNTAWAGPWGVSFTANLTSDVETGLGGWDEKMFIDTIRTGRHQGRGRPLLPPMPWPMYKNANDADLKAIFAYLQSLPPAKNHVPQPVEPPEQPAPAPAASPTATPTPTATKGAH